MTVQTITAEATVEAITAALAPIVERERELTAAIERVEAERAALVVRRSGGEDVQDRIVSSGSYLSGLKRQFEGIATVGGELYTAQLRIEGKGSAGRVWECRTCHHEAVVCLKFQWGEGAVCQWCAVAHLVP